MSSATSSAALLIFTQVASRALTFAGNQVILRYSSPTLLGIAVQLELVSTTVLYFARESLRVALQRRPPTSSDGDKATVTKTRSRRQGEVNTSYLAICLGLILGTSSFAYYKSVAADEIVNSPNYSTSFVLYALATLAELLSEPFFVVIQQNSLFRSRAAAETRAAIARCLIACSVAFYAHQQRDEPSTLPFAAGQLAYGITLFASYYDAASTAATTANISLLPRVLAEEDERNNAFGLFPKSLLSLSTTLYAQSIFKLLLTQGDALLLSFFAPLDAQGAFALVSNYGGLLARLLFQPIEESSRNTFGTLLSRPSPANTHAALAYLARTLHIYILGSLPVLVLGPPLLPILTPFLLSAAWRTPETTKLLGTYVYYIPLMALNGVLDAFVTSVATPQQLRRVSLSMVFSTAIYGASVWLFLQRWHGGARQLVWANATAMLFRVGFGGSFADDWIKARRQEDQASDNKSKGESKSKSDEPAVKTTRRWFWTKAFPQPLSFIAAAGVWLGLYLTLPDGEVRTLNVQHLSFVALAALVLGTSLLLQEWEAIRELLRVVVPVRVVERMPLLRQVLGEGQRVGEEKKKNL
jgi:oligosaccharide translocation protein RFT1